MACCGWLRRLARFSTLSQLERKFLLEAVVALVLVRIGLFLLSFPTLRRFVSRIARKSEGLPVAPQTVLRLMRWAMALSARFLPGRNSCLAKAFAASVVLGRAGHSSQLHIGVAKNQAGCFEAHAWLESCGEIVVGDFELGRYAPLPELTPP